MENALRRHLARIQEKRLTELVDAPLVAECEWDDFAAIVEDFEKLLLARAGVRLMIFDGNYKPGSKEIAERLCRKGQGVQSSRAEDAWLLAAWEKSDDDWWFRYFTIEMNAAIPFPPPAGADLTGWPSR